MATEEPDQTIDGVEQRRTPPVPDVPMEPRRADYPELVAVDRAHYVVTGVMAQGGVGRILEARDLRLGRDVAIKELLPQHRDAVRRFEREARITAKLQHPAIIHVYEAGVWPGGEPFYAMPNIAGRSLDKVVAERATLNDRLGLLPNVIAVADALAYAHSQNIIHRDLKPSNVLVGEFGETVVIDWGVAKDLGVASDPKESMQLRIQMTQQDTISGSVVGTPAYMPPEQARGKEVDARADVYALGALLYKVLTGVAPYVGASSNEVLELVKDRPPPTVHEREPGAPPELVAIVDKAMARYSEQRYPSASALAQDLKRFQTGQLVAAHRYTTPELIWRGLKRYRVVVAAAAILVAVAAFSLRSILAETARAEAQQVRAELGRTVVLDEQGLTELLAGHAGKALAYFVGAAYDGVTGGARGFMIAAAIRPFEAEKARLDGGDLVAVSPDGKLVVTGGLGVLKLWTAEGKPELGPDGKPIDFGDPRDLGRIRAITFDPAGRRIAAGGDAGVARIWKLDGTPVASLGRHEGPVNAVAFSPDGMFVVTASDDHTANVWDVGTIRRIAVSRCHTEAVVSASFSRDGTEVVTASEDNTACVWNAHDGSVTVQLRGHENVVNAAIWTPDGRRVVTASSDGTARLWTADRGKQVGGPMRHEKGSVVTVVAMSSDGRFVVSAGSDRIARVWRIPTLPAVTPEEADSTPAHELARLAGHTGTIVAAAISPDDDLVATVGLDHLAKIWDPRRGRLRRTFEHDAPLAAVGFVAGSDGLVAGGRDGSSQIWNLNLLESVELDSPVQAIAVARDGTIAAGTANVTLHVRGGGQTALQEHVGKVYAVAFTPDGRSLITGGEEGDLLVWDVATAIELDRHEVRGKPRAKIVGAAPALPDMPQGQARSLAVSRDGALVAAATGSVVRIYDLARVTDKPHELHAADHTKLQTIVYGADDTLVAGTSDGSVVMWDRDGRQIESHAWLNGPVTALALSPGDAAARTPWSLASGVGTTLAVAGPTEVRLFKVVGGHLVPQPTLIDDPTGLRAVAFSADGALVITAGSDGARIWDVATGKLLGTRDEHGVLAGLAVHGDTLWTASDDHTVDEWNIAVDKRSVEELEQVMRTKHVPWHLDEHDVIRPTH